MTKLFFKGMWNLFKVTVRFFNAHTRYLFLLMVILVALFYRQALLTAYDGELVVAEQDVVIAQEIADKKPQFLGGEVASTSAHLGSAYNVIISPALWFSGYDDAGVQQLALALHIATVVLLFIAGKRFFSYQAGIFAGGLYAVSALVFSYANGSWRLDILPFFVLLFMHTIFNASASARPFLTNLAAGMLVGICLQLHYASLFLALFTVLYCLGTNILLSGKQFVLPLLKQYLTIGVGLLLVCGPFLYDEATHGFTHLQVVWTYLLSNVSFNFLAASEFYARLVAHYPAFMNTESAIARQALSLQIIAAVLAIASFAVLSRVQNSFVKLLNVLWIVLGVLFFTVFSTTIPDFHFSPLYPVFFLLIGNLFSSIYHLQNQDRIKLAKQLISSTAESETYTTIKVDVTDKKKLALHYLCVTISVFLFLFVFLLNALPVFLPVLG